jgi:hypothetical protein
VETLHHRASPEPIDPDPFTIGLMILGCMTGGGAFLEARRGRLQNTRQQRDEFRSAWFAARRTVIHFKRIVDEFETYILEDGYARSAFRVGVVRIAVEPGRHRAMRRLVGQATTTASRMSDDLDELSAFLGVEDQPAIDAILGRLSEITVLPENYRDVIRWAREAIDLYSDLLETLGDRERFEEDTAT